jgi:hypothetical protein
VQAGTIASVSQLPDLPRLWPTIGVPGIFDGRATYSTVDLDSLPPVAAALDGSMTWLLGTPTRDPSLTRGPDDPAERDADAAGLRVVAPGRPWPEAFRSFIEDPEPRRHVRSATACHLDLAHFGVRVSDGGELIHFLSDQQWVVHWLLYLGPDGSEAVVATPEPLGFDDGEGEPVHEVDPGARARSLAVCADSFEQFLYHYWAMNELFFRLAVDKVRLDALPTDLHGYAERYPRTASAHDIFDSGA